MVQNQSSRLCYKGQCTITRHGEKQYVTDNKTLQNEIILPTRKIEVNTRLLDYHASDFD